MCDVFFFFERRWRNENLFPVILRLFHEIWKVYVECSKKVKWSSTLQLSVSFPRLFPIFLISLSTIDVQLCHTFCYLKKRLPSFSVVKEITACNSLISTYAGLRPPPPFLVYCIKSLKKYFKKVHFGETLQASSETWTWKLQTAKTFYLQYLLVPREHLNGKTSLSISNLPPLIPNTYTLKKCFVSLTLPLIMRNQRAACMTGVGCP